MARTLPKSLLSQHAWVLCSLICVVGFVLRVRGIGEYWTNPDEGIYYSMITWERWGNFWSQWWAQAHPPLYYLVLRVLGSAFDASFTALRWPSVIGGTLWIPAAFLLLREWARIGAVSAAGPAARRGPSH